MQDTGQKLESLPIVERIVVERIGTKEVEMREVLLHVREQVALWSDNPRLRTVEMEGFSSEEQLEEELRRSRGYDGLKKSIEEIGQMQPIYVKETNTGKFLTLEGNTRVTVLRELDQKHQSTKLAGKFRHVSAKVVPKSFDERDITILLAGIHVGGPGVRDWGRYIEAQFVYETVMGRPPKPPVMTQTELAASVQKSLAWVTRYRSAYEFAMKFVEHVQGDENPRRVAAEKFSVLEEISKARTIGPQLRDYDNAAFDELREEVFEMVRNNAFKEYRDARFLKELHEDPEAWQQLKSGEPHVANRLARQVEVKGSSPKAKISALPALIRRAVETGDAGFDDEDVARLQEAMTILSDQVHEGVHPYRLAIKRAAQTFDQASRAAVMQLSDADLEELSKTYGYFLDLVKAHHPTGSN
jgi:hypothetical protein